ncbi:MAG: hypothetical protein ABW221_11880 [Vicinamibacteria bacterium]
MLKLILAGAAALPIAATGTVAATGIAWVDVREGGPEGTRIVLPVPLVAAEIAAAFVPTPDLRTKMDGETLAHLGSARKVVQALRDAPDGELVRVEEGDETVVVAKEGDTLRVHVEGNREKVDVNVPLAAALDIIRPDGRIDASAAVRGLRYARFSTLVEVQDGDDHVKISVW